jgi:prevent-host-death family protein
MNMVGIRGPSRNASRVVEEVRESGRPVLVTVTGHPAARLTPIDEAALEDHPLANAPTSVEAMKEAERDRAEGQTRDMHELFDELGGGSRYYR